MKISEIKKQAREALVNNWGYSVLVTLIMGAVNLIPDLIRTLLGGGPANAMNGQVSVTVQIILGLLTLFLAPLSFGFSWYFLALSRGSKERWTHLFEPFDVSIYLKMLGASLLIAIYTLLWSLLLIVPGIIKGIAYSQTPYILKDQPKLTINEAITKSRKMMNGHKGNYFLLILSFIGWGILGVLTLGIGFLWIEPYISTSSAVFYDSLKEKLDHDESGIELNKV